MTARRARLVEVLLVAAGLALLFVLAVAGSWDHSATYDEPPHFGAGVARVAGGDHRFVPDHPPLAQSAAALAALPRLPDAKLDLRRHPGFPTFDAYMYGRSLLFEGTRADGDAALRRARAAIAAIAAIGGLVTWWAARTLFGAWSGIAALFVLALDPAWLAHGGLVTTDVAAAVGFLAVVVAAAHAFARAPAESGAARPRLATSLGRQVCFALAFAFLALGKFSWPLVLPAMGAMAVVALVKGACEGTLARAAGRIASACALAAALTFGAIWASYGFRWSAVADPVGDEPFFATAQEFGGTEKGLEKILARPDGSPSLLRAPVMFAWSHRLLPQAYVYGFAQASWTSRARASFLAGERYQDGRAAYFPIAFATKTPVGMQLLILLGLVACASAWGQRRRSRLETKAEAKSESQATGTDWPRERLLLAVGGAAFVATYGIFSLAAPINIGHRHLLPLEPWFAVVASAVWLGAPRRRLARALGWLALGWLVVANVRAFPNYLGSFNEFAGGPEGGRRILVDSNVDWGQDLARLGEWQQREAVPEIQLARFGSAPPAYYGVRALELPSYQPFEGGIRAAAPWTPGVLAISATQFESVYFVAGREDAWDARTQAAYLQLRGRGLAALPSSQQSMLREMSFGRLLIELHRRSREPDEMVGTSTLVFRIGADEMKELERASLVPIPPR